MIRETIVLVHGTWGAESPWYQPGSDFCRDLEANLRTWYREIKVWSHADSSDKVFRWTGDNSWSARSRAARELATYLRRLDREGWTFHLVAHSHGGNVVLEALRRLGETILQRQGKVVLIGTPVLHLKPRKKLSGPLFLAVAAMALVLFASYALGMWTLIGFAIPAILLAYLGHLLRSLTSDSEIEDLGGHGRTMLYPIGKEKILLISSKEDEAFQLLAATLKRNVAFPCSTGFGEMILSALDRCRDKDNVAFPGLGSTAALVSALAVASIAFTFPPSWAEGWQTAFAIGRIACIGLLFLSAAVMPKTFTRGLMLPLRLVLSAAMFLDSVARQVAWSWYLRRRAWGTIQGILFGTSGSPYTVQEIEVLQEPYGAAVGFEYEEIGPAALAAAKAARGLSLQSSVGNLGEYMKNPELFADDLVAVLYRIMTDIRLVHAIYYTHPDCKRRIASWIAESKKQSLLRAKKKLRAEWGGLLSGEDIDNLDAAIAKLKLEVTDEVLQDLIDDRRKLEGVAVLFAELDDDDPDALDYLRPTFDGKSDEERRWKQIIQRTEFFLQGEKDSEKARQVLARLEAELERLLQERDELQPREIITEPGAAPDHGSE